MNKLSTIARRAWLRPSLLATAAVLLLSTSANSKTIMWLGNWFVPTNTPDSLMQGFIADSVRILKCGGTVTQGCVYDSVNLKMKVTTAYVAPAVNPNVRWHSSGDFVRTKFPDGRIRVYFSYRQYQGGGRYGAQTQQGPEMNGTNGQMPNFIDNCINTALSDTIWIYAGLGNAADPNQTTNFKCTDHNPYYVKQATIHLYNAWPGKTTYVQMDDGTTKKWHKMYPEAGRPGWHIATIWGVAHPDTAKFLFASSDPAFSSGVEYLDANGFRSTPTGTPFDFSADAPRPIERWVSPSVTGGPSNAAKVEPKLLRTVMVQQPNWSGSSMRIAWKGFPNLFLGAGTNYEGWYSFNVYEGIVPSNIALKHPFADTVFGSKGMEKAPITWGSYANWISLANVPAGSDTIWVPNDVPPVPTTTKPRTIQYGKPKVLAFRGYDYAWDYFPFSEVTNSGYLSSDGPWGGPTLVKKDLGADGLPQWSGNPICSQAETTANPGPCKDPFNAPNNWFKPLKNTAGKALNYETCWQQELKLNPLTSNYEYNSRTDAAVGAYFPIDTLQSGRFNDRFTTERTKLAHNYHVCGHAKSTFEYNRGLDFTFDGDDDVWVYINKKIVIDLGGQHSNGAVRTVKLDTLGLTEGSAYQFDLFWCERHTGKDADLGSNLRISTSMNLIPSFDYKLVQVMVNGKPQWVAIQYKTETDPGKCVDQTSRKPVLGGGATALYIVSEAGEVYEVVPDSAPPIPGIPVKAKINAQKVDGITIAKTDSSSITELDTLLIKTAFKSNQAICGTQGCTGGKYTIFTRFQNDPAGTQYELDSFHLDAQPFPMKSALFDRNGDGIADSLEIVPERSSDAFTDPIKEIGIVWQRADGTVGPTSVLPTATGVTVDPSGQRISMAWEPSPFGMTTTGPATFPAPLKDTVVWVTTQPLGNRTMRNYSRVVLTANGPAYAVSNFVEKIAPIAVDTAEIRYDLTSSGYDTIVIKTSEKIVDGSTTRGTFPGWFVPSTTKTAMKGAGAPTLSADGKTMRIAVLSTDIQAASIVPGIQVRLGSYAADTLANIPGDSSTWVPLKGKPPIVAWIKDLDGNGQPDFVGLQRTGGDFSMYREAVIRWNGDSLKVAWMGTGGTIALTPAATQWINATGGTGTVELRTVAGVAEKPIILQDSMSAIAVRAQYAFGGAEGPFDTLLVTLSEPVNLASPANAAFQWGPAKGGPGTVVPFSTQTPDPLMTTGIRLLVPISARGLRMKGDTFLSVKPRIGGLGGAALLDKFGRGGDDPTNWVPIEYGARPLKAALFSSRGNGIADSIVLTLVPNVAVGLPAIDTFVVTWGTEQRRIAATALTLKDSTWSGRVPAPFTPGITSSASATGSLIAAGAVLPDWKIYRIEDHVAPIATGTAQYRFDAAGTQDTIIVSTSESVSTTGGSGSWIAAKKGNGPSTAVSGRPLVSAAMVKLIIDRSTWSDADSVQLREHAIDVTEFANIPDARSTFVPLRYGPQPIRGRIFDRDGDGEADSVGLSPSAPFGMPVPTRFTLSWNNAKGGQTTQSVDASALPWSATAGAWTGILPTPFAFGATDAGSRGPGELVLADATSWRIEPLEDKVPPVAIEAVYAFGREGAQDTLLISASEAILEGSGNWATVKNRGDGSVSAANAIAGQGRIQGGSITLLIDGSSWPGGDSVQLRGRSMDVLRNAPSDHSRFAPIRYKSQPIVVVAEDPMGAGFPARVAFHLTRKSGEPDPAMFHAKWNGKDLDLDQNSADTARDASGNKVWRLLVRGMPGTISTSNSPADIGRIVSRSGEEYWGAVKDEVPPVAVAGRYEYGEAGQPDILRVELSEPVRSTAGKAWFEWGTTDRSAGNVVQTEAAIAGESDSAILRIDLAQAPIPAVDQVRIAFGAAGQALSDVADNSPDSGSRWAPLSFGLPPLKAWILDPTGRGQGSAVRIELARPVAPASILQIQQFEWSWSDSSGKNLENRQATRTDIGWTDGSIATVRCDITPFAAGMTACLSGGCGGRMIASDGLNRAFPLLDSMAPVLLSAKFRYSTPEIARDTLVLHLSEDWGDPEAEGSDPAKAFTLVGGGAHSDAFAPALSWNSPDARTLRIVVDTALSATIGKGDSAWLVGGSAHRVHDVFGNIPGENSRRVEIVFGLRPLKLSITPYPPLLVNRGSNAWTVPAAGIPNVEILTRLDKGSASEPWTAVRNGSMQQVPMNDTSRMIGILVTVNRPLDGHLYVYDNIGTAIWDIDLKPLREAWIAAEANERSTSQTRQVYIAWNGVDPNTRRFAASGVYLVRIVTLVDGGEGQGPELRNSLFKVGIQGTH